MHKRMQAGRYVPLWFICLCIWILSNRTIVEINAQVRFGSIVRLCHEPTGHTLVAQTKKEMGSSPKRTRQGSIYLRKTVSADEEAASQWYLHSRYKLRREGDPVRVDDFVVLKSVAYKDFYLSPLVDTMRPEESENRNSSSDAYSLPSVLPSSTLPGMSSASFRQSGKGVSGSHSNGTPRLIGLSLELSGWRLKRFQSSNEWFTAWEDGAGESADRQIIVGGNYVRITHVESKSEYSKDAFSITIDAG
jgi:hypothetical protein